MDDPRHALRTADLNEAGDTLIAVWADGHRSELPLAYLRQHCPCATCRDLREKLRENPLMLMPANLAQPSTVLTGVEPVGRYGMRIEWEDGHDTGIYTFEYLRELCPCAECAAGSQPLPTSR